MRVKQLKSEQDDVQQKNARVTCHCALHVTLWRQLTWDWTEGMAETWR